MASQKTDKDVLYTKAQQFVTDQSDQNIANGWAGSAVSKSLFYAGPGGELNIENEYIVDQGSSDSEFIVGPLRYSSSVQGIEVVEDRAVEAVAASRSDNPVLIDTNKGYQKASIRLLFEGMDEINTQLRPLITLFKTCPVISVKNEMLNKLWSPKSPDLIENLKQEFSAIAAKNDDQVRLNNLYSRAKDLIKSGQWHTESINLLSSIKFDDTKLKDSLQAAINRSIFYLRSSSFIPVALDSITLNTIPDIPLGVSVVLNISHIDARSVTEDGILRYLSGGPDSFDEDPRRAVWLKKWIRQQLSEKGSNQNPTLSESDFGHNTISFFERAISRIQPLLGTPDSIKLSDYEFSKVVGISSSISHKFAYFKLIGKSLPCVQHIGISGRSLTLDIDFSDRDDLLEKLSEYKETADNLMRSEAVVDRVMGWVISTPLNKLLGQSANITYAEQAAGVYIPITLNINTTEIPGLKNGTITCLESNISYNENSQVLLEQGGIPISDLEQFFNHIIDFDRDFRAGLTSSNIYDYINKNREQYSCHLALFPKDNNGLEGILNRDTIKAIFVDPKMKYGSEFRQALLKLPIATGKVTSSDIRRSFLEAFMQGWQDIGIRSPSSLEDPRIKDLAKTAQKIGEALFPGIEDGLRKAIVSSIVISMFGEPREAENAINLLRGSKVVFSPEFRKVLFSVLANRPSLPSLLSKIYDKEGLYLAFNVFYYEFINDKDLNQNKQENKKYSPSSASVVRQSNYRDFKLPTYGELFGRRWRHFAPTFDSLGISYFNDRGVSSHLNSSSNPQDVIAVSSVDKVPPYIWFYTKGIKEDLRRNLIKTSQGYLSLAKERYLSMNLKSTRAINLLNNLQSNKSQELAKIVADEGFGSDEEQAKKVRDTTKTLVEIITQNYTDSTGRLDIARFEEDLSATSDLVGKQPQDSSKQKSKEDKYRVYYNEFLHPDSPKKINLYFTTTGDDETRSGGEVTSRYQISPIAGAAYIKVMHQFKYLIKKNGDLKNVSAATDEALTTVGAGKADIQRRNLKEHTIQTVKSSISQIQDDFNSCCKLWPAARVYFIERRGNDLIADDVLFSTDSIISIDITDDKDDAALAVIKIADPLKIIQSSSFGSSSTATIKSVKAGKEEFDTVVLANKRKLQEGFIKTRKIEQGRAIQIRMGYGACSEHLPIVFTGRITEIEPGDELTIVAQSWKAELINRQVNFYSNNSKSWGAKDLVVQAVQLADPDGIGQHFPEKEARAIIDKLSTVQSGVIRNTLNVQRDSLLVKGASSITTDISRLLALDVIGVYDPDARKPGLDTRLKNIWYPDMSNTINNFFKWRNIFGIHGPDFINDYWLIPLQPTWDVIKEAARHTWNYIVQVVPFDSEATLFFGHPDQLYTYTRGSYNKLDQWKNYATEQDSKLSSQLNNLMDGYRKWDADKNLAIPFKRWPIDDSKSDYLSTITINGITHQPCYSYLLKILRVELEKNEVSFRDVIDTFTLVGSWNRRPKCVEKIINSGLPIQKLNEIGQVLGTDAIPILLYLFYGIKPIKLHLWPTYEEQIKMLLGISINHPGVQNSYQEISKNSFNIRLAELKQSVDTLLISKDKTDQIINEIDSLIEKVGGGPFGTDESPSIDLGSSIKTITGILEKASDDAIISRKIENLITGLKRSITEKAQATVAGGRSSVFIRKQFVDRDKANQFLSSLVEIKLFVANSLNISNREAITPIYKSSNPNISIGELLVESDYLFKAFVYYFGAYIQESNVDAKTVANIKESQANSIHPTMKTFRVHHYIDSEKDIIDNSIVVSTSQMWNTVVINRPSENPADTTISDGSQLNVGTQVKTTVGWVYWPKPAISKVVGLQYHPGLSLANKKVKICTELNCISDELAAKLACNNLAEGIRKMYRGTLIIRGRNIKPYDRIILNDTYTGIKGCIEVESVVHHFSAETGWITNISPQAVCESNPGASIIQTAIHEANFERTMNIVGKVFDAFNIVTLLGAPGVGLALKASLKAVPAVFTTSLKGLAEVAVKTMGPAITTLKKFNFNPVAVAGFLQERYKGTATKLFLSYAMEKGISSFMQHSSNFMLSSAWVDDATDSDQRAAQLPVVMSPLIFNGAPWTAGLEADDILFSVPFHNLYYSYHDLKTAFIDYVGALPE